MSQHLNTVFRWCNDVEAMRHFYTNCLNLTETYYQNDDEHGWLTYQLGEVLLVFTRADEPLPEPTNFAMNPAYSGGQTYDSSWVIEVEHAEFDGIVERIIKSGAPTHENRPFSNREGHIQFIVRDPMGMTIELYATAVSKEDANGNS